MLVFASILPVFAASGLFVSLIAQGPPANIEAIKQQAQERREAAVQEFQTKQAEAQEISAQKRQEVQEKVQTIRDEQKKAVAQRLSGNLDRVNQNWVNHWLRVLDNLTQVLIKMETRVDKLETLGHDIAGAREKIVAAHEVIAEAQEVLNEQAGQVYEFEFVDESTLGSGIQAAIAILRADLGSTREKVLEAIHATRDALSSLKDAAGVDTDESEEEEEEEEENGENGEGEEGE